jgi:hypothetical protein
MKSCIEARLVLVEIAHVRIQPARDDDGIDVETPVGMPRGFI